jgi:hypothetical protein
MTDGAKKPVYQPPTLGGEMERHGLIYETLAVAQSAPHQGRQKRSRNRNKNNRRDNNGPMKETRMNNGTNVNGTEGSKLPEPLVQVPGDGLFALTQVMQEHLREQRGERGELRQHFKQIGDVLTGFNTSAQELTEGMEAAATRSREAAEAAMEAKVAVAQVPEKLNEVKNLDNLKGDVRRAVIQTLVSAALGGIVVAAIAIFGGKPEAIEVETPHAPPAKKTA